MHWHTLTDERAAPDEQVVDRVDGPAQRVLDRQHRALGLPLAQRLKRGVKLLARQRPAARHGLDGGALAVRARRALVRDRGRPAPRAGHLRARARSATAHRTSLKAGFSLPASRLYAGAHRAACTLYHSRAEHAHHRL